MTLSVAIVIYIRFVSFIAIAVLCYFLLNINDVVVVVFVLVVLAANLKVQTRMN